jgi:phosphatidyl-myo-inositol dimannoside synthase
LGKHPHQIRAFLGAASLAAGNGGIARVARITARALLETNVDLSLASYLNAGPLEIGGCRISTAHGSKPQFAALCYFGALQHQRFIYDSAGIARAHPALLRRNAGYAVWMHGIEAWEQLRPAAGRVLRKAGLVLANSQYTLDRYRSLHGDLPNARVCWLATEDDVAADVNRRYPGPPSVLILARIDDGDLYKGHSELIAAWPRVVAAVPQARLLIGGGGSGLAKIEARAKASSAANWIEVLGFIKEADIAVLWRRAHVFAMPSRGEGFGIVYAEAMRHGLPVIASVHDAGQEINIDGETGFNVSLDRSSELAERIIHLLREPDVAMRMGSAGQRRWHEQFRFSAFKRRLLPLFMAYADS